MKVCFTCKVEKPRTEFWKNASSKDGLNPSCRDCRKRAKADSLARNPVPPEKRREYVARYKAKHPERVAEQDRKRNLKRKFGIDHNEYDAMNAEQGGLCAICGEPETALNPNGKVKPLAVDHCHVGGHVRGLLCARCNTAIGLMQDDVGRLESAIEYLTKWAKPTWEEAA